MGRNWLTICRWFDISALSVSAGILAYVATAVMAPWLAILERYASRLSFPCLCLLFVIMIGLCVYVLRKLLVFSGFSLCQLRLVHRYPPPLVAVLPAIAVLAFVEIRLAHSFALPIQVTASLTASAIALAMLLICGTVAVAIDFFPSSQRHHRNHQANTAAISPPRAAASADVARLLEWIEQEQPISSPEHDLLGHASIARRLAQRLRSVSEQRAFGLVGYYGIGKSSLIQLVRHEIGNDVLMCEVSCWGFEDSRRALEYILESAVSTIGQHVDCSSLRSLPETYQRALSGVGSWVGLVIDLLHGCKSPIQQLQRITLPLRAAKTHLLIIIEDLDRNESEGFDSGQVLALLQHLKSVDRVSFILSGLPPTCAARIDFAKLCDHIEALPRMERNNCCQIIANFQGYCRSRYDDIDPVGEARISFEGLIGEFWGIPSVAEAVAGLVRTPRVLKHVLRHVHDTWTRIHGECDFDDLLVVNILRYCAPEAFGFILENSDPLRGEIGEGALVGRAGNELSPRQKASQAKWDRTVENVDWDTDAALVLLFFLIPGAEKFIQGRAPAAPNALQGVRHTSPTDYWHRILTEQVDDEVPDQLVLRAIDKWIAQPSPTEDLPLLLHKSQRGADVWGHFCARTPPNLLLQLAEQLIDHILDGEVADAKGDHLGLIAVLGTARRLLSHSAQNEQWLGTQLKKVMPRSLGFANDLYHYWGGYEHAIVSHDGADRLRVEMLNIAKEVFHPRSPESLLNALGTKHPYAVRDLVTPPGLVSDVQPLPCNPAEWHWLAPVLLGAANRDTQKIIPQIVNLIFDAQRNVQRDPHTGARQESIVLSIKDQLLKAVFGSWQKELMEILVNGFTPTNEIPQEHVSQVTECAKTRLEELSKAESDNARTQDE